MRLSTKTRYGLRILVQLAETNETGGAVKGRVLAKEQEISEPYLEQIMIPLKGAGFVTTIRGCNGGYVLGTDPEKITVLQLIELFDGPIEFSSCRDMGENSPCNRIDRCPSTYVWDHLSKAMRREAEKFTLREIVERHKDKEIQEYVI
ncbi:MAG: RrF2 family transcriptional regulator [Fibrobacterota bacterium]